MASLERRESLPPQYAAIFQDAQDVSGGNRAPQLSPPNVPTPPLRPTASSNHLRVTPRPIPEDVVLSWDASESSGSHGGTALLANASTPSVHSQSSTANESHSAQPTPLPQPPSTNVHSDWSPPTYVEPQVPSTPVTYTFSQSSPSSMLLLPPQDSADTRALYHISVGYNCFMPDSYITIIHRGPSEQGPLVGMFEMGGPTYKETVSIRGKQHPLRSIVTRSNPHPKRLLPEDSNFHWNIAIKQHVWTPILPMPPNNSWERKRQADGAKIPISYRCVSSDHKKLYAQFFPETKLVEPGQEREPCRIVVQPVVHAEKLLDDIVLSCLVVERWRALLMVGRGQSIH